MRQIKWVKIILLSLLAGISLGIPFLHFRAGWLSLICLLPFLYLLDEIARKSITPLKQVLLIWLAGIVMMLTVLVWLPLTDVNFLVNGLSGWEVTAGLYLTYVITSLLFSLGFLFFGFVWVNARLNLSSASILVLIPTLWVVSEWLRSWPYAIFMSGSAQFPAPHWRVGDLGFAASVTPFVYSSRIIGLFGLSFIIVLINLIIYKMLKKENLKFSTIVLAFIVALSASGYLGYHSANGKSISAAALQIGSKEKAVDKSQAFIDTRNLFSGGKTFDLIVLPEHSGAFDKKNFDISRQILENASTNPNTPVVSASERKTENKKFNTLTVFKPDGKIIYQNDKPALVPVGEALPYVYEYAYNLSGKSSLVDMLRGSRELNQGKNEDKTYEAGNLHIASAACSAIMDPELYRRQINHKTDLMTNSASLSMFDRSYLFHHQSIQTIKFMSVSNARPFIQSTKGGISLIVDHNGRIKSLSKQNDSQLISSPIITNNKRTPYNLLGEWVLLLSGVVLLLFSLKISKRSRIRP